MGEKNRFLAVALVCLAALACASRARAAEPDAGAPGYTVLAPEPPPKAPPSVPALAPAPDPSEHTGRVIVRVDASLDDAALGDVALPPIRTVRVGEPFTPAVGRRALDEALATGRFADGRVSVTREGPGVHLIVHLVPRKLVHAAELDLHGVDLPGDEILREAEIVEGAEIVGRNLAYHRARVESWLARRGFPSPVVNVTTRPTDDPLHVVVTLDVSPGVPRTLARRVFYVVGGDTAEISEHTDRYPMKQGARVDQVALGQADSELETFLRSRGWHRAEVSHDVVLQSGFVTARIRIDAGPKYVPRFTGNEHYDADALTGALGLEQETDRSPANLAQKLKTFYMKRGFLDVEVRFELRGGQNDKLHHLVFKIVEHERVSVVARTYPCLKEDEIKGLTEGGPRTPAEVGNEIDSYLEEELPGTDLFRSPHAQGTDDLLSQIGTSKRGARPTPIDLDPGGAFSPETYERALAHVQELYRNEGFLNAIVGPAFVIRRTCDKRSPPGECVPVRLPRYPPDTCAYDAQNVPLPAEPPDATLMCVPDPAKGIECESRVIVRVPIKLGPRARLYDLGFRGPRAFAERQLADVARLQLGTPVSNLKLDDARRRILEHYKEQGYAYADVRYRVETSLDHTRARAVMEVTEGQQVIVRGIVIRGNRQTSPWVIRRRIALEVGQPFRESERRKTRERIATLGTFSSIDVELEEPYLPQRRKMVVITVVERTPGYAVPAIGFSTGEGGRVSLEFGYGNIGGDAISLTLGARLSYLPTEFIFDPAVRKTFVEKLGDPGFDTRTGVRVTAGLGFPEIGLGPLIRTQLDGLAVHDVQRDFYVTKFAVTPSLTYSPITELRFTISESLEYGDLRIYEGSGVEKYARGLVAAGRLVPQYLLLPDGKSIAVAQRFAVTWDRRDNAFDPMRGTNLIGSIEHVDAYPQDLSQEQLRKRVEAAGTVPSGESHFVRLSQTFGGYFPIIKRLRFAAQLRLGTNVQLTGDSQTYPDRQFFLGGNETMRGWALNNFIPQDVVDAIYQTKDEPECAADAQQCTKVTPATRPVKGGNLVANGKLELRIPIRGPVETVFFGDVGNLWTDPAYPFRRNRFPLRAAVGTGIRIQTPIAPIAADYGVNITREPYEDAGAFHLGIGLY
jgi:outer membrane protein assembly factor BamA